MIRSIDFIPHVIASGLCALLHDSVSPSTNPRKYEKTSNQHPRVRNIPISLDRTTFRDYSCKGHYSRLRARGYVICQFEVESATQNFIVLWPHTHAGYERAFFKIVLPPVRVVVGAKAGIQLLAGLAWDIKVFSFGILSFAANMREMQ